MTTLLVPPGRLPRWVENFAARHGETVLDVRDGRLHGRAADGSTFAAELPFEREYAGPADLAGVAKAAVPPEDWGVLLVRKGGFAVGRLRGDRLVASKVGRRHVQGRTKAGGQSQQRFARRRDNQARAAYDAAAGHARELLGDAPLIVVGGDRDAVRAALAGPGALDDRVGGWFLDAADPRRHVLEQAILDAGSVRMSVVNADA